MNQIWEETKNILLSKERKIQEKIEEFSKLMEYIKESLQKIAEYEIKANAFSVRSESFMKEVPSLIQEYKDLINQKKKESKNTDFYLTEKHEVNPEHLFIIKRLDEVDKFQRILETTSIKFYEYMIICSLNREQKKFIKNED